MIRLFVLIFFMIVSIIDLFERSLISSVFDSLSILIILKLCLGPAFIANIFILCEAKLFDIKKFNYFVLSYLGLVTLTIITAISFTQILTASATVFVLLLTNPFLATSMIAKVLQNPVRFGQRLGMLLSVWGLIILMLNRKFENISYEQPNYIECIIFLTNLFWLVHGTFAYIRSNKHHSCEFRRT